MKVFRFGREAGLILFVCAALLASDTAIAGGGSWGSGGSRGYSRGSWGSSGGSWGSSGGSRGYSQGSWGSSGGSRGYVRWTPVRNLFGRIQTRRANGSSGGYYSSGSRGYASYGSYGSRGSSTGSWGTSHVSYTGTTMYAPAETYYVNPAGSMSLSPGQVIENPVFGQPMGSEAPPSVIQPQTPQPIIDEGGGVIPNQGQSDPSRLEIPPSPGPTPADDSTEIARVQRNGDNNAVLSVKLPVEAKIYVNGRLTRTKGDLRNFVSRHLKVGKKYEYRVKAVLERNGETVVRNKNVKLAAGLRKTISFDFDQPPVTTVVLKVPSDAKVILAGNETSAIGSFRTYETQGLKDGESWKNYKIQVSVNQDGKTVTREETISISAGQTRLVAFEFDSDDQVVQK